ncbi:C6 transcription factor [Fusarium subglutinans]|uniref:C6 transcription factor n=1 Tax=Gibberella subglutinans TaxID=42677 RepID=A0A8H5QAS2_GIBSU|nr:C6 transcription factor [Fusarium subglutinans]KAF5612925.1 C6 transcription factor [Fusarium subglutinans]
MPSFVSLIPEPDCACVRVHPLTNRAVFYCCTRTTSLQARQSACFVTESLRWQKKRAQYVTVTNKPNPNPKPKPLLNASRAYNPHGCKRNKLDCVWPEPQPAKGPSRSSFGAASTSSQQSVASLRQGHDADSVNDPVIPDPVPEEDRAAENPDVPQNGDSSPVHGHGQGQGDTHMVDAEADVDIIEAVDDVDQPSPSQSSNSSDSPTVITAWDADTANALTLALPPSPDTGLSFNVNGAITMPMSMLPEQGHQSYELLSYYLSRTANSMGNGSTDVNPFIAKLIPLAFSKPLVLQLILAQSAAHRQASAERHPSDEIAQRYYTDSLRMFRNVVDEYVSGNAENTLVLTVGSLIMCLTEVAKGDIHGTIFDHLSASKSLVSTLLTGTQNMVYDDLPDFLIEYYMHIAATSMISIDPQYNSQSLLSPDIEVRARNLVARKYVGQLCGCWLEILILISQIFHLGQVMSLPTADGEISPSPDNIVNFAFLQSQVMGFFPDPSVTPYTRLAGLVWKQAALLYLWTVLGKPHQQPEGSFQRALVESAVTEAVALLDQFPASHVRSHSPTGLEDAVADYVGHNWAGEYETNTGAIGAYLGAAAGPSQSLDAM